MTHAESSPRPPSLFAPAVAGRERYEVLQLSPAEVKHARALRLGHDAPVRLTDGHGTLWNARLSSIDAQSASCVLEEQIDAPRRLLVELAFAIGNKAHVLWLVEKATEMGAQRLKPLQSDRSLSVAAAGRSPAFWARAERRALAALKQSGGAWLPEIDEPCSVSAYADGARACAEATGVGVGGPRVLLELSGEPLRLALDGWSGTDTARLVVGPEGGWTGEERRMLQSAGFREASLGPLVLRFETAAIAGLVVAAQQIESVDGAGNPPLAPESAGG